MRAVRLVVCLLLVLEPSLGNVAHATKQNSIKSQIDIQLHSWEQAFASNVGDVQKKAKELESFLFRESSFQQVTMDAKSAITTWINNHGHLMDVCFSAEYLSPSTKKAIKEDIAKVFSLPQTQMSKVKEVVDSIPHLAIISDHFNTRPDWALSLLTAIQQTTVGAEVLKAFRSWRLMSELEPQALVQLKGDALQDSSGSSSNGFTNMFGSSLTGKSSQPSIDSGASSSGNPDGMGPLDSSFVTGSSSLTTILGSIYPMLGTSMGSSENSQASGMTSLGYSSMIPNTVGGSSGKSSNSESSQSLLEIESSQSGSSEASAYGSGLQGSDSSSGVSVSSIGFSQGSSPSLDQVAAQGDGAGGAGGAAGGGAPRLIPGCCLGLWAVVVLMGVGLGGEFYIKNMHTMDAEKYEEYMSGVMTEQVTQLKEYLAANPQKAQQILRELEENPDRSSIPDSTIKIARLPFDFRSILDGVKPPENTPTEKETTEKETTGDSKESPKAGKEKGKDKEKVVDENGVDMIETDKSTVDKKKEKKDAKPAPSIGGGDKKGGGAGLGQMLSMVYVIYNAVPAIISKHFGFYLVTMMIALLFAMAASNIDAQGVR
jgi:hypothetical protein